VISDAAVIDATIVAVGSRVAEAEDDISGAAAWYSSDGLSWQAAAVAGAEAASMESVVAGPAGLVAVGYVSTDIDDMPRAWLSSDGHSWEQVSSATFTRGQMTAVAADASGYLAVGLDYNDGTSLAWTSSDGHSWSAAETIPVTEVGDAINGVIAAAGGFLCFGSTADGRAAMWLRAAGTWQQIEGFEALADVNDVLVTPAGLMAVGAGYEGELAHTVVWTSSDGQAWAREPAGEQPGEMSAVEMLGSGYLAVGSRPEADELVFGAAAWSSADGRTWQPLAEDASFEFARIFELLRFGPGAVALGERALDQAGEELAPMTWLATPR
jgi:hypothetical protein